MLVTVTAAVCATLAKPLNISDFAVIRYPGNICDDTGYGAVAYNYMISKHAVSVADWTQFYNDSGSGKVGLFNAAYTNFAGASGSNAPAVRISANQAAQYCNWLTTGSATNGAYAISSSGTVTFVNREFRNMDGIVYVVPTENEWYKAAFFNPDGSGYSDYSNGSDIAPPQSSDGITGFWYSQSVPWAADSGDAEQNGTYSMMGSLWEWVENFTGNAVARGRGDPPSAYRYTDRQPDFEGAQTGFRVVAIPLPAPEFRTVYDNDLTHILSNESPYYQSGQLFSTEMLYGSVDETKGIGVDVHALQPGYGWVPCWESAIYPYTAHTNWLMERYGTIPRFFHGYDASQITGEFIKRCRQDGMAAFISLRMNDYHHKNYVDFTKEEFARYRDDIGRKFELKVSSIYMAHPEYRLNISTVPPQGNMDLFEYVEKYRTQIRRNNLWNWAIPEVRQHNFNFIREICETYDIDGFELDFVRHPWLFKTEVPLDERREIMTAYVRQVRSLLDRTARNGKYCWLSIRLPFRLSQQSYLGLDVKSLYDVGVDLFNLAPEYQTAQQNDLARIHEAVPDAPLYLEVTQTQLTLESADGESIRIMMTPEQYYTTAHLAYSRGAKGITAFNIPYYRDFAEPPFEIFQILHDPALVAQQPQHYFLTEEDYDRHGFAQILGTSFDRTYSMDMVPPNGGWTQDGRLRLVIEPDFGTNSCFVYFNGELLDVTADVSASYSTSQSIASEKLRAWVLPYNLVSNGVNRVRIVLPQGNEGKTLRYLDIGIR